MVRALSIEKLLVLFSLCTLVYVGCSDDNPIAEEVVSDLVTENYRGYVIDQSNNEPVANLSIHFTQRLGDSYIHGIDSARTDEEGYFNIAYTYNADSLYAVSQRIGVDTSQIFHDLDLITDDYLLITQLQDGEPLPVFNPRLTPGRPIEIDVYAAGLLKLEMVDTLNIDQVDRVDVSFQLLHPFEIVFDLDISNPDNQTRRWDIQLPADLDILMEWTVSEGPNLNSLMPTTTQSDTLNVSFGEELVYVLIH